MNCPKCAKSGAEARMLCYESRCYGGVLTIRKRRCPKCGLKIQFTEDMREAQIIAEKTQGSVTESFII